MATVLILEPDGELRELFRHVVERLGYATVVAEESAAVPSADLILLEPASQSCLQMVRAVRTRQPDVPIVCASIEPLGEEATKLSPVSYLLKPFSMSELEKVVAAALPLPARTASSR